MKNNITIKVFAVVFCCIFSAASLRAQELMVPDDDRIFAAITDNTSPFYYPTLMSRFQGGDMTLTTEDFHYLYYGFAFSDRYDPISEIPEETNILMIFDKYRGEPDEGAMFDIIYNGLMVMERDPFSPNNLNFLTFAYGHIGDTLNERLYFDRLAKVLDVIGLSGDGTLDLPMQVIRFTHASDWIASKGLQMTKSVVVSRTVQFIGLEKNYENKLGFYFDYGRIYSNMPSSEERSRSGWQINDVPIGRARNNR